ncbi:AI-2E family transporter [soil metagenome]
MSAKKLVVSTYLQYIFIVLGALLLFAFVRQLGGVLLTFLLAGVLAYALNPVVRLLEGWRIPRVAAVLGVFLALVAAVVAALLVLILPAISQVQALVQNPEALTDGVAGLVERTRELPYVGEQISSVDQTVLSEFVRSNAPSAGQVLNGALGFIGGVFGVFGTILNLFLMLIVAIYLLLDRERITRAALSVVPETVREQTVELFRVVEDALIKYLKAQLLLCGIMGAIGWAIGWAIAFFTFRDYALLIGLWVGVTEIIPVIGAFLGAVPAVAIALFAGGLDQALLVTALFLLVQQFEGNVLVPRVMGGSVGVHPLWVLFATLAATALYGVVGAIFAVPIVAIVAATVRYLRETLLFERWRESLVTQAPSEAPAAVPSEGETAAARGSAKGEV